MAKFKIIAIAAMLAFSVGASAQTYHPDPHHPDPHPTPVPEPTDFALFMMGVAGLLIGRRSARRRHRGDDDTNA